MGPGPSDVHPRVLTAMARPTIGHLDPAFIAMMEEIKALLQYVFQTSNALTLPISAPGDRKSTRLNSSHSDRSRMPSSA